MYPLSLDHLLDLIIPMKVEEMQSLISLCAHFSLLKEVPIVHLRLDEVFCNRIVLLLILHLILLIVS